MKAKFSLLLVISMLGASCTKPPQPVFDRKAEEEAIMNVLKAEQIGWNNGNLEEFMEGFWKSDSLQFMSARGINRGWQETLDGYKKRYPDLAAMGSLSYNILQMTPLAHDVFVVMGEYHLVRGIGNLDGTFTSIFKKINGKWVTIYDHAS